MSFPASIPTTATLRDNIVAQLSASLSQTIPLLPKAFAYVLATVLSGVFILLYKYCGFIFLQLFVAYATLDETVVNGQTIQPLLVWGRQFGVPDPFPATSAELTITVTVLSQTGTLQNGQTLLNSSSGVLYQTVAPVALNAATVTVNVSPISDQNGGDGSGTIGNMNVGDALAFSNAPSNVGKNAVIAAVVTTAADAETVDSYRGRILDRTQARPQGGAYADYREWALTVPGVIAVYPYASTTPGEVDVYVEADEASSGSPDGIPTLAQLDAVRAALQFDDADQATRQPATVAKTNILPISRIAIDPRIGGLDVPNDARAATESAIEDGLREYLSAKEPFIVGLSALPRDDRITNGGMGAIVDGIANAAGGSVASTQLYALPVPAVFMLASNGPGTKVKLGTIHYV